MASGGAREGSGRKKMNPEDRKVQVTLTLRPETAVMLEALARRKHLRKGTIVDMLVKQEYNEKIGNL